MSDLQRDFDALAPLASREQHTWEAFVRIRARLTPDRERVARAMHAEVVKQNPGLPLMQFETLSGELKAGFRQLADAAIKAMEKNDDA